MTTSTRSVARRVLAVLGAFAVVLGLVSALAPATAPSAAAASASDFRDGYLISDANFFDSKSMTATDVQAFLNSQVANCRGSNGMPCLKDYYAQSTPSTAANSYCSAFPGGAMSAAQLIVAVSQACGISPKVILVMLQKEQGLITATSPTARNYSAALGQGCPDDADCDPAYAGFFYQIYGAARQMQIYIKFPQSFSYQLGWNNILYNPNSGCGTKSVYIQNNATRALYIYTPYTPNQAALANLYGEGDYCSSYGNRNFWRLYTDWFGSATVDVKGRIDTTYSGFGGSKGWLGGATGDYVCELPADGCYRPYANGRIYASNFTAGVSVAPAIQKAWDAQGAESGVFGYPQAEAFSVAGGWMQSYGGGVAVLPDGRVAQFVAGAIGLAWLNAGGLMSGLGAPTSPLYCVLASDGCVQVFANGWYYSTPASGAHYVNGPVLQAWSDRGSETGALGYPLTDSVHDTISGGDWARFQGGVLYVDKNRTSWVIAGGGATAYADAAASSHGLGAPAGDRICGAGGCVQRFAAGAIAQPDGGFAQYVAGPIGAAWLAAGGFSSSAGAPTGGMYCGLAQGGCLQVYTNGWYYWSPASGARLVPNALLSAWSASGSEGGAFGYPLAASVPVTGGSVQSFQGGVGVVSSTGVGQFVAGPIGAAWLAAGGFSSSAGAPTGGMYCGLAQGGCLQVYTNGWYYWSPASGARLVPNALLSAWSASGSEGGAFGYPLAASVPVTGGSVQSFQGGVGVVSSTGVGQFVAGPIGAAWLAAGGFSSSAGAPTGGMYCGLAQGGCLQVYTNGWYYWSPASGARLVPNALLSAWSASGSEGGAFGYPLAASVPVTGGSVQSFQGGVGVVSSTGVGQFVAGPIGAAWLAAGGFSSSAGAPTGGMTCDKARSSCSQSFSGGEYSWTADTGVRYQPR